MKFLLDNLLCRLFLRDMVEFSDRALDSGIIYYEVSKGVLAESLVYSYISN